MEDPFYVDGFLKYIQKKPFDLVWIMNDYPLVAPFITTLNMLKKWKRVKILIYFLKVQLVKAVEVRRSMLRNDELRRGLVKSLDKQ